jgi:acyl-CoA thioesterase
VGDFEHDTSVHAAGEGAYDCEIAPEWWVIAGPNGGYIGAIIVRALSSEPELGARPLRSITIHYLRAPAAGPARVFAEADRHGRSVSFMRARLEQDGRTCASALAVFADDRPGFELDLAEPPEGVEPPPPGAQEGEPPHPHAPPFAHEFVHLPRFGEPPFAGGAGEPLTGGWLRLRDERPLDAAALVALSDSWFPAVFAASDGPLRVPTLELTVHVRAALPLPADWVLGRFSTSLARDGFLEEDGAIWSRDGRLVALSRQLALAG